MSCSFFFFPIDYGFHCSIDLYLSTAFVVSISLVQICNCISVFFCVNLCAVFSLSPLNRTGTNRAEPNRPLLNRFQFCISPQPIYSGSAKNVPEPDRTEPVSPLVGAMLETNCCTLINLHGKYGYHLSRTSMATLSLF